MAEEEKDCFAVLDEVTQQVTFDELMRRAPESLSPQDRLQLIRIQRNNRARWAAKAEERLRKKEEKDQ